MSERDDDSYEAIAETSWDDIPEPKILPKGTWKLKGKNAKRMDGGEGTDYVLFFYKANEPMSDVGDEDLDALGKDYDFNINDLSYRIYTETLADYKMKVLPFLAKHGVTPNVDESTGKAEGIDLTLKRFKGSEVLSVLGKRTFKNKMGDLVTDNTLTAFASVEVAD